MRCYYNYVKKLTFLLAGTLLVLFPIPYLLLKIVPELQLCSITELFQIPANSFLFVITLTPVFMGVTVLYKTFKQRITRLNYIMIICGLLIIVLMVILTKMGNWGPLYFRICDLNIFEGN